MVTHQSPRFIIEISSLDVTKHEDIARLQTYTRQVSIRRFGYERFRVVIWAFDLLSLGGLVGVSKADSAFHRPSWLQRSCSTMNSTIIHTIPLRVPPLRTVYEQNITQSQDSFSPPVPISSSSSSTTTLRVSRMVFGHGWGMAGRMGEWEF